MWLICLAWTGVVLDLLFGSGCYFWCVVPWNCVAMVEDDGLVLDVVRTYIYDNSISIRFVGWTMVVACTMRLHIVA